MLTEEKSPYARRVAPERRRGSPRHSYGDENGSHADHDGPNDIATASGTVRLEVFEDGVPPRFHLRAQSGPCLTAQAASVETIRPDGTRQVFIMRDKGDFLESVAEIPEPHTLTANVRIGQDSYPVTFEEHEHAQDLADVPFGHALCLSVVVDRMAVSFGMGSERRSAQQLVE